MSDLDLADAIIRHSLELQRLSASQEAEALSILRELEPELRQLLASGDLSEAGKREIEALISQADDLIANRYAAIPANIDVHGIAVHVAERTADIMRATFPSAALPSATRLASLTKDILIDGAPSSAWWARQAEDLQFKFAAQVRQGVIANETQEQIVARIIGRGDEPGILDFARRNVRSLVHSSVMTAANQARLETFRKNGKHLRGVRWLSTLDSHTCVQCAALDGAEWDLAGDPLPGTKLAFQLPPAHFSCRCVASPVSKGGLDEIFGVKGLDVQAQPSVRASSDGPTNAMTFDAFLKRQSPEFVADMLGVKRAELWRAGKITLRDLVSGTGRPLTLEQLQSR